MCTAAYIAHATNEAEKAATIDIVEVRAVGRFGRMFVSGSEDDVKSALKGAQTAIDEIDGTLHP